MRYADRMEAGRALAKALETVAVKNPIVLGLPRGGIPVAAEVAKSMRWPLDVLVSRKLGAPGQPELGIGAVSEGDRTYIDRSLVDELGVPDDTLHASIARERREVHARAARFRRGRPFPDVQGRTVVLVDDGIAMGATIRAALKTLRPLMPERIIVAVPVAARQTVEALRREVDEVVAPLMPEDLYAIGAWYEDFRQVEDDEVDRLLHDAALVPTEIEYPLTMASGSERLMKIHSAGVTLAGDLTLPDHAVGLVVFAHGSGSSRRSVRNRAVAEKLRERGLATLLFDLLTEQEEEEDRSTSALRFDVPLLAQRLLGAVDWALAREDIGHLPIGLFGASTGAAAALAVAALRPSKVAAVVSRGGRPDLAMSSLAGVRAPTLLIVGGFDTEVLALNEEAYERLTCHKRLFVVPGATHLFEETGALDEVSQAAGRWFADSCRAWSRKSVAEETVPSGP